MTHRQDDTSAPARGADIIPFPSRRPETSPVPAPELPGADGDDDGPSAA